MIPAFDKFSNVVIDNFVFVVGTFGAFSLYYHFPKIVIVLLKDFQQGIFHNTNTKKCKFQLLCRYITLVFQHMFIKGIDTCAYIIKFLVISECFCTLSFNSSVL